MVEIRKARFGLENKKRLLINFRLVAVISLFHI